jgi:endonuclease/exonuclease/phosphatase family metal-dependent hydrolase
MYGPANKAFFPFRTNSGIWILSKIPLKMLREIEFGSRFGVDSFARKGAILLEGFWKCCEFQIVGTHLQSESTEIVRRHQCSEIANLLLKPFAREKVTQIVCGDFNIEQNDEAGYSCMLQILEAENGKLEGEVKISFDEIDNSLAWREGGKRLLIDYILVRNHKALKLIKRKISIFRHYSNSAIVELSDHYAVEARIVLSRVA